MLNRLLAEGKNDKEIKFTKREYFYDSFLEDMLKLNEKSLVEYIQYKVEEDPRNYQVVFEILDIMKDVGYKTPEGFTKPAALFRYMEEHNGKYKEILSNIAHTIGRRPNLYKMEDPSLLNKDISMTPEEILEVVREDNLREWKKIFDETHKDMSEAQKKGNMDLYKEVISKTVNKIDKAIIEVMKYKDEYDDLWMDFSNSYKSYQNNGYQVSLSVGTIGMSEKDEKDKNKTG